MVSDGEASKVGYATYIKDRLTGFGGEPFVPKPQRDLADYPEFRNRMIQFTGPQVFRRLCCIGDIQLSDHEAVKQDIANFKAAIAASQAGRCVHAGGLAWRRVGVPAEPALSEPRRLYRRGGRCDAARNTRRSPMPASWCSSTVPIWRWRATPGSRT